MVSIFYTASVALVAALAAFAPAETSAAVSNLPAGQYYRPSGAQVSGRIGATTEYRRSPCPALNSLANAGYLPRDGKNITVGQTKNLIMDKFNIGEDLAALMASLAPAVFDLNDLSLHNNIEHDSSLSRADTHFGADPALTTQALINDLVYRGLDGKITLKDVAAARVVRIANSKKNNPEYFYGGTQSFIADAESGLLMRGLGGFNTEEISFANFYSFVVEERFPTSFKRSSTPIMLAQITNTSASLAVLQV